MAEHIILSPTIQRLQSKDLNEKNLLAEKSPIKSRQDKKLNLLILGLFHSKKRLAKLQSGSNLLLLCDPALTRGKLNSGFRWVDSK